jgi:hypothetical protein
MAHEASMALTKSDFSHAEEFAKNNKSMVELDLSKTGKEKIKQLNKSYLGKEVVLKIGSYQQSLKFKVPIVGDKMEAGPFTHDEAQTIINDVNK